VVKESGLPGLLGYTGFRHYCAERLGLPGTTVEQRAELEAQVARSPGLQEARRQKVAYEKLRLLARLPEREIASWIPRAQAMTCIALRRKVLAEKECQMRAARRLAVPVPRRIAVVVAAAFQAVRDRAEAPFSVGKCLAIVAWHFVETWKHAAKRPSTRSRKVRERDQGFCQVPGCSHRGTHAHHVHYKSHGGGDEPGNLASLCPFHHLGCVHGGYLRVAGRAPDALTWFVEGVPWSGPVPAGAGEPASLPE
jgi:hypothetical protein